MIKVIDPKGNEHFFESADSWQVAGTGLAIYKGAEKIAEFLAFLVVGRTEPAPVEPEVQEGV